MLSLVKTERIRLPNTFLNRIILLLSTLLLLTIEVLQPEKDVMRQVS